MAVRTFPVGLGGTADAIAAAANFYLVGTTVEVFYVDSQTGDAGNNGLDRDTPLATLAQAVSAVGGNDDNVIILMSGHSEEVTANVGLTDRYIIIGEGTIDGKPGATLTLAHATADLISFGTGSAGSEIRNVHFRSGASAASPVANAGRLVEMSTPNVECRGCYFDLSANTDEAALHIRINSDGCRVEDCSFVISDGGTSREGVQVDGSDYVTLANLSFDCGTGQFASSVGAPVSIAMSASASNSIKVRGVSFLRGGGLDGAASGYYSGLSGTENVRVSF